MRTDTSENDNLRLPNGEGKRASLFSVGDPARVACHTGVSGASGNLEQKWHLVVR